MAERISDYAVTRLAELEARIGKLETAVGRLLQHAGIDYDLTADTEPDYLPEVRELIRYGKEIQAIKLYRDRTGASMQEAKAAIDRLAGK